MPAVFLIRYLPFLLVLALWIYSFIDCLLTPEDEVRHLPKLAWVFIVLLFGQVLVGPVAWLAVGRNRRARAGRGGAPRRGRGGRGPRQVAPDDDPEFLASLREENRRDESLLRDWEADLRRREEELRRRKAESEEDGGAQQGG